MVPWPNLRGKRCLEVGGPPGLAALELARRGAAQVVSLDLDLGPRLTRRTPGPHQRGGVAPTTDVGVMVSDCEVRRIDLGEVSEATLGSFDVVVADDLLGRVRDPLGAAESLASVTAGMLLSIEPLLLWASLLGRGRALVSIDGMGSNERWFSFNGAAHRRLLEEAGFAIERVSKPYVLPGVADGHNTWRDKVHELGVRAVTGSSAGGVLHRALLARRRR